MPPRRARDAAAEQTAGNPQIHNIFARLLNLSENFVSVARARNAGVVLFPAIQTQRSVRHGFVQIERTLERLNVAPEGGR